ncbi:MAG: ABC transporter substrate-binding protein [Microbacteriaceae bacterium]
MSPLFGRARTLGHRRLWSAIALATAAGLTLASCSSGTGTATSSDDDRTLVIGVSGDPATLDPGNASESIANEIIKNTYFQWTKYGVTEGDDYGISDTSEILGEAASYELSDDGLTASFTITDGATFPSGNPITSDDFIYTVQRALATNTGPVFIFNTAGITDVSQVQKVDDTHFTITLPAPSPMFGMLLRDQDASVLDSVEIASHATDDDPWATDWMAQNSLGGGAYTLESYDAGNQVVLEKNPDYPDADDVYFDTVVLQIIPSETDRAQLLANGTLDIAEGLSADAISNLEGTDGVKILDVPSRAQNYVGLVESFEPFSDVRVREALSHAVPYEELAEDVGEGYTQEPQGLWPQNSASFDDSLDTSVTTEDLDLAQQLLDEAGYGDGFEFTLDVSTSDTVGQALAVALQSNLAQIGVTMDINQLAPAAFSERTSAKEGQAFMVTGSSSYVDDPYYSAFLFYTSSAVLNRYDYSSDEVDSIADKLATELDTTTRQELSSQLQATLNADVPILSLGEPDYLLAMADDIDGFVLEPDSLLRFSTLSRD